MTFVLDGVAPEQTLVLLKLEDARDLYQALRALDFQENCVIDISKNGLRIIVDDQNCVQGIAYFKSDLFTEFILNEDVVTFRMPLSLFTECLTAFGTGVSTVMKMTYDGYGEPLKLMLEKDGIVARYLIKTQNPDIVLDFDFNPAGVTAKIIMKPWMLKETFHELDQSSPTVGFRVDRFSLNVITEGDLGKIKTKFPHYSEQIERLECKQNVEFSYRLNLIKRMTPSLDICSKLSLRIDHRGILSIQFMVEHNENSHVFLEFFVSFHYISRKKLSEFLNDYRSNISLGRVFRSSPDISELIDSISRVMEVMLLEVNCFAFQCIPDTPI